MTMRTRNILVSLLAVACALAVAAVSVSAASSAIVDVTNVRVDGKDGAHANNVAVIAGETIPIEVFFTAREDASHVRMQAEIRGTKVDVENDKFLGDLKAGKRYSEKLMIQVPYELQDEKGNDLSLEVEIWNDDFKTEYQEITLRVQRVSYNVAVMSINSDSRVRAGDLFPVDVVLKNVGHNKLDDLYVTVSVPGLQEKGKEVYFGDLVELEDEDNDDTVRGRVFLRMPYDAASGVYKLQVDVRNDDLKETASREIYVENEFASSVIVSDSRKSASVGEDAVYELTVANPTNSLKLYRFVVESPSSVKSASSNAVVAIPAGSSKVVKVTAGAEAEGEYEIDVNIFSGENLVETVNLNLDTESEERAGLSRTAVITVILVVVFVMLLAVFIVLMTRKPKTEELGESYY